MPPTLKLPAFAFKILFTATILAATVATSRGALIHRWSFSEASGTNLTDSVGTANGYIAVIGAYMLGGMWGAIYEAATEGDEILLGRQRAAFDPAQSRVRDELIRLHRRRRRRL